MKPRIPFPLPVARSPISSYTMCALGELPEWSIGAVSKTVEGYALRGFESLTLRGTSDIRVGRFFIDWKVLT